jgi:hypothetical protein
MLQSDYNYYPYQCILYYCNFINSDSTVYLNDLSDVCLLSYDVDSNIQIEEWYIADYFAPSTATILTYVLSDVLTFYDNYYIQPQTITNLQSYKASSTNLSLIRVDSSMIGYQVYNSTIQKRQYLNSSLVWTDLY